MGKTVCRWWQVLEIFIRGGRVRHIDIVEPNETGRNEIQKLFSKNDILSDCYTLYSNTLENFSVDKKYDIIIAEQFLQHCINWKECLSILKSYAKPNAIIIVTCADSIGLYVELMKRFVGRYIVSNIKEFDAKIHHLTVLLEEYLNSLKGMNKTHEDYIADMFFDDFILNGAQMSMIDAIDFLQEDFDVLGASQNIFTDYSWYKDLQYDYLSEYKKQYQKKKHMFLFAGEAEESIRTESENELLENAVNQALKLEANCERKAHLIDLGEWNRIVCDVTNAAQSEKMTRFNKEFLEILGKIQYEEIINFSDYSFFWSSFGKASQYLSFVRK